MTFGGQPTPWTQAQIDALNARYDAMQMAGGLLALNEKTREASATLSAALTADDSE
jgi:hypothetical protein